MDVSYRCPARAIFYAIEYGGDEMGEIMRLRRGFHCFLWGSLASVLYAGPTNPDQAVKAQPSRREASAAVVQPDAAPVRPSTAVLQPKTVVAEPVPATAPAAAFKLTAVTPPDASVGAGNASVPNPSVPEVTDECLLSQDCIDQYLFSLYERARKIDTIKVAERYKA